jgi:hypothetical protein
LQSLHKDSKAKVPAADQAAEKTLRFVILSEAKNLSSIYAEASTQRKRDSSLRSE